MINSWDQPYHAPPTVAKISGAHSMTPTPAMAAGVESRHRGNWWYCEWVRGVGIRAGL